MKLTKDQVAAIKLLAKSKLAKKFYWTGGTLLASKYLQHRRSEDIDFFSETKFSFDEVNEWAQEFIEKSKFRQMKPRKIYDRWEFLFKNSEQLRIEFVYYNKEKKALKKRRKLMGVMIDSLEDIAANKTLALIDRNEPKDLFDIYFLLTTKKFSAPQLLELVKNKFSVQFPEDLFWSESFKVLPLLPRLKPLMVEESIEDKEKTLKKIEAFFKNKSNDYLSQFIKG